LHPSIQILKISVDEINLTVHFIFYHVICYSVSYILSGDADAQINSSY